MLRKLAIFAIVILMVMVAINIDRAIALNQQGKEWKYQYIELNITYNLKQSTIADTQQSSKKHISNTNDETKTIPSAIITLDSHGQLCLHGNATPNCVSTSFSNSKTLKVNSTFHYYLLETQTHIITVKKNQTSSEHLKYISKSKDHHMPKKQLSTYFNIPGSDYFIFEWSKLYIVYEIADHSIQRRLFLEKASKNYTQHFIRAERKYLTLLSFPNRNQILLQIYDCEKSKVELMSKTPIDGWITKYSYKSEGRKLMVEIETAEQFLKYTFSDELALEVESKNKKLNITQDYIKFDPEFMSTTSADYLRILENMVSSTFSYLKKRIFSEKAALVSQKSYSYHSSRFYKENRYYTYDFFSQEFETLSLGKYLIPTQTPVFHNIENNSLPDESSSQKTQPVHYIDKGAIRSEAYMTLYEVYPKYEAEWVGLSKGFVQFYPNKQSPGIRFARTPNGVMVFDGIKFKGIWKQTVKSDYQTVQYLNRKPEELEDGIVQGHYYYTGMIGILELDQNGFSKALHFFSGFNGKKMYVEKLEGIDPQNIFFSIQNNDILISCYIPQQQKSVVIKIQFYSQSKNYAFLVLKREYIVQDKVIRIERYLNNYYFTIVDGNNIVLCSSKTSQFNNRRPLSSSKYSSNFESKMILKDMRTYQAHETLDVKCIKIQQNEPFEITPTIKDIYPLAYHIVIHNKQSENQRFLIFDVVNLLDNRIKQAAFESKVQKVKVLIGVCVFLIIVFSLICRNAKSQKKDRNLVEKSDSKDKTDEQNQKPSKQKRKKNE